MNIYITEAKIITSQHPPKEEHALIGKYTKQLLLDTIKEFPELEHNCQVYTLIHALTKEVVKTVDLASFSEERNLNKSCVNQLKYKSRVSYKHWNLVPNNRDPLEYLDETLKRKERQRKSFSKRLLSIQ